ncbi:MAG: phosphoribosylformylglycinamidine synthase I [Candidatus Omnitrophota bacterium]
MKKVKAIILRTAGTNCDKETAYAFRAAGAETELVHINALSKNKSALKKYHILAVPGGFTYGDDVASGKILANELKSKLTKQLADFISSGKLIIGICNGFQVLVKMGLLPNIGETKTSKIEATLSLNDSGKFEDRWVHLKHDERDRCVWTVDLPEIIYIPIAHAEGKFIPKDEKALNALKKNGQVVFRYTDECGRASGYPDNPNGSVDAIAGICDPTGRILGMMPHPERHVSYLQHPNWRRAPQDRKKMGVGLKIFKNSVKFVRNNI